jgi:UDP-N-acetylglucosamine 2-epimerase (non-hydrolysing)
MSGDAAPARLRLMVVMGTRPEIIKLAPVILAARARPDRFEVVTVHTGQHREMAHQAMADFGLVPDIDLEIMQAAQDVAHVMTAGLRRLFDSMAHARPDWVVVQGDTTTTFAGALAAFYHRIPVAHVEAGLRTGDRYSPFPEEMNRSLTARLADLHFAPTAGSRDNLLGEGIADDRVLVTGNTAIDALSCVLAQSPPVPKVVGHHHLLVTAHRRENHGEGIASICEAVLDLLDRYPELTVSFPVHLSPAVREVVFTRLDGHPRVRLTPPLGYRAFVQAMAEATLILSDSGGVQEEAASLDTPVLILRDTTERQEAVDGGSAFLVGTDRARIVEAAASVLEGRAPRPAAGRANPFGDGQASRRILDRILQGIGPG